MEAFAIPGVAGIIEGVIDDLDCILIQERYKAADNSSGGLIEIPAGKIREFENIFDCLRREIMEETGLEVIYIEGEYSSIIYEGNDYRVVNYTPFSCSQNLIGEYPIMVQTFICRAKGELLKDSNESRNIKWIPLRGLQTMLEDNPQYFYPMHIDTLKKYIMTKKER